MESSLRRCRLELEEDPESLGEVKTYGDRAGPHRKASGFHIDVVIVHEIHGFTDPDHAPGGSKKEQYASFIVIRFELNSTSSSAARKFRSFSPKLRFESSPYTEPRDDPWIECREPIGKGKTFSSETKTPYTHDRSYEANLQAQAPGGVASAGGKVTDATSKQGMKITRSTMESGGEKTHGARGGGRLGWDTVFWNLRENEEDGQGVGDRLQVALLVRRRTSTPFKVIFTLKASVDFLYAATLAVQNANPFHTKNLMEWDFDPEVSDETIPKDVDLHNLAKLDSDGTLEKYGYAHSEEYNPSIKFYRGVELTQDTVREDKPETAKIERATVENVEAAGDGAERV